MTGSVLVFAEGKIGASAFRIEAFSWRRQPALSGVRYTVIVNDIVKMHNVDADDIVGFMAVLAVRETDKITPANEVSR